MFKALTNLYHFGLAFFGALFYGFPSRKIFVLGVTGTKGKTTLVELLNFIFERAGYKTAFISSAHIKIGGLMEKNMTGNSMPGRFFIQRFLNEAVRAGCGYAFIEVTSQGVLQSRHRFIDFDAAVFTNLEPEHIEAHGSLEKYREAKLVFFKDAAKSKKQDKYFFVNSEDSSSSYFAKAAQGGRLFLYSGNEYAAWQKKLENRLHRATIAAAVAVANAMRVGVGILQDISLWRGVPGRMEIVQEKPFKVVVDYAHTPKSLEFVYESLKKKGGRIICVLGAAGGRRDKWKRPKLGEIAACYCDEIILTNEDPYSENPESILDEIASGFSKIPNSSAAADQITKYLKIADRKEAIKKAISLAKKGDTVVMTGKGSEEFIHLAGGKKMPWNEREVVEEALRDLSTKSQAPNHK